MITQHNQQLNLNINQIFFKTVKIIISYLRPKSKPEK